MNLKRATEGLQIIVVGGILLANSLGVLDWGVWFNIFSLWPLLIVSLGIELIGKALDSTALRVVANLVIIGGLLYGALAMSPGEGFAWRPSGEEFSASRETGSGVRTASARIEAGVGELALEAGEDDLIAIEGVSPWGEPDLRVDTDGRNADVRVEWPDGPFGWPGRSSELDVKLDRDLVWDVNLDGGVSSLRADFTGIDLAALDFDAGVGDADVVLDEPGRVRGPRGGDEVTQVKIDAGISRLTVRVPEGTSVEIESRGGLKDVDFSDDSLWERVEDDPKRWRTERFDEDGPRIIIDVEAGISSVEVETYGRPRGVSGDF